MNSEYEKYWLFKEISAMSKEFRHSIKHTMPKENRCGIGDETLQLMRDIKFTIYKGIHAGTILDCDSKHKIIEMLYHLKIMIDECLEDGILLMKGEYTIHQPRKRLADILQQLENPEVQQA